MKVIAITGTPGVGKTSVVKILKKEMNANIISLTSLVKEKKIKSDWDKVRMINIVDAKDIRTAVRKEIKNGINIVDGHLSHLAKANIVVILRCRPDVLIKRMKKKKWKAEKINENIQAEILDVISIESLQQKRKIIEIDTTKSSAKKTALLIKRVLNSSALQRKYPVGKIDWTRKFSHYLINYPVKGC
ncbi:MAG: adenylate kinase family protein [Candidatus Aenigmarchaeota archaeon]|nr:adenylate kinase family protein [Candidatus Aenigmarchaeota archaeon]